MKGGALYRYKVSVEVERVDLDGPEGDPVSMYVEGDVRAPASGQSSSRAIRRAMHDAAGKIARKLDAAHV